MSLGKLARVASLGRLSDRAGRWLIGVDTGAALPSFGADWIDLAANGMDVWGVSGAGVVAPGAARLLTLRIAGIEASPEGAGLLALLRSGQRLCVAYAGVLRTLGVRGYVQPNTDPDDQDRHAYTFLCADPLWAEVSPNDEAYVVTSAAMSNRTSISTTAALLHRGAAGAWAVVSGAPTAACTAIAPTYDRLNPFLAACGSAVGLINVSTPTPTWVSLGTLGGSAAALLVLPDGTYYAAHTAGVSKRSGGSWSSMSASAAQAIALGSDGELYAAFGTQIQRNPGTGWGLVGGVTSPAPNKLLLGPDAAMYAIGGGCWRFNGFGWTPLGGSGAAADGVFLPDGRLAVVGTMIGGAALWNGFRWQALDYNAAGLSCTYEQDRGLHVISSGLTAAGGLAAWGWGGRWRGGAYFVADGKVTTRSIAKIQASSVSGGLLVGLGGSGTAAVEVHTAQGVNAATLPLCWLDLSVASGSALVYGLETLQAGGLALDLRVLAGETVRLDLVAGSVVSTLRGDLAGVLRPGSQSAAALDSDVYLNADAGCAAVLYRVLRYGALDAADVA